MSEDPRNGEPPFTPSPALRVRADHGLAVFMACWEDDPALEGVQHPVGIEDETGGER